MTFVTLNALLASHPTQLDPNFTNLGRSAQLYLSYDQQLGWSLIYLNCLQRICRFLFGCYASTHLNTVVTQISRENTGTFPPQLLNKIQRSWQTARGSIPFPVTSSTSSTSQAATHDAAAWLTQYTASGTSQLLADIFQQTKSACINGFIHNAQTLRIDADATRRMQQGTRYYNSTTPIALISGAVPTAQIQVINGDTFDVALAMKARGLNPVGLNMANAFHAGGGAEGGAKAQEEDLFRRSNYYLSLYLNENPHLHAQMNGTYRIADHGAIYTPEIQVFRSNTSTGYAFMPLQTIAMIASAAYNLNHYPGYTTLDTASAEYQDGTKEKIRAILRLAILHGHDSVVLGAFGCGAFLNLPATVANFFLQILQEPEFIGRFREIAFAVLDRPNGPNITTFTNVLHGIVV